jgi:hypothetical protein
MPTIPRRALCEWLVCVQPRLARRLVRIGRNEFQFVPSEAHLRGSCRSKSSPAQYGSLCAPTIHQTADDHDSLEAMASSQEANRYYCPFEIRLCSAKEGGMAVSAVWTEVCLLAPCQAEPRSTPIHTGETPCAPLLD